MRTLIIYIAALLIGFGLTVSAAEDSATEQDRRSDAISKTLRCVVCQNQSIYDSDAPLAQDMRRLVRKRVEAGDSNAEVRNYLRERYGDYVLLTPPFQSNTWVLWLSPGLLLCAFGVWYFRSRSTDAVGKPPSTALSPEDRARVHAALAAPKKDAS